MDNFRSPKVVRLEQENEALLAQVEGLRKAMLYEAAETRAEFNVPDEVTLLLETVASKTPVQHLDSLKARIEEETIERLIKKIANEIDWIAPSNFEMIANDLPRKYSEGRQ